MSFVGGGLFRLKASRSWLLCCVGIWFVVKKFFKDIDLDAYAEIDEEGDIHE